MRVGMALFGCLAALVSPVLAGVVYEIEVTEHLRSPVAVETIQAAVEGKDLKIGIAGGGPGAKGDMVFRGERGEVVMIDHTNASYHVMDPGTMKQLGTQVNDAMAQMQKALEAVPEAQREFARKIMLEKMPAEQTPPPQPKDELRKTAERAEMNGYPCIKYEVYRDGRKLRELWVTGWDRIEGGAEAAGTFQEMADFFAELMASLPQIPGSDGRRGSIDDNMFEHMKELGGFPVVTREFRDDGALESESKLQSATRRDLDPDDFEPPSGYKRQEMFGGR